MSRSRRISIVMPCFNHGEFLREAVDSVLSANRDDLELVMVDDGSTDERTRKEMEHLRARGIKVIWQENKGPAAARNAGIAASQADYILPLDADDRLRAEWIDRGLEILDTDSTVGVVCWDTKFFGKRTDLWLGGPFDLNRLLQQSYIPCTALYRRSVWEQNGGYDSTIVGYEDWEFWLGAVEHGWKFAYIPEIFFDYRKAGESMLSRAGVHVKETADFVAKKHGKLYREAWLQALGVHDSLLLRHGSVRWTSSNLGRLLTAQVKQRLPLVRNIVLALVATFIIVEAGRNASPSAFALLGAITTSGRLILAIDLLLLALILIQAWFTLHLVRQNGRLITRLEAVEAPLGIDGRALVDEHAGLYVGTKAPDFALRSLDGGAVMTLSALCGHELPVLLIFGDPDCGPCAQLMPEIVNWQRNYSDKITIALLATGSEEANRAKNAEHGLRNILLEGDSNISESYQVNGTPAAMVVGKDGRVAGRLVLGPGRIRPLFERTVGLAPAIQLPVQGPTTPTTKTSSHLQAISVHGPFHGVTGYDHHVREFVRELHRQGIAVELQDLASWHPARLPDAMRDPWFDSLQQDVGARVALHFCMPHQVIRDRTKANVNYTMFEADRVPVSWIQPSGGDDFVIVPTDSSRRAWIASGQREQQLRECPLGIDASLYSAVHEPMNLTLPDGSDIGRFRTRFLNVSEWIPRKNVDGLLRSWMKATTAKDDAVLIVKLSRNGPLCDMFPSWLASLEQHAGGAMSSAAPIHFVETTLSDHDMPRLYATA